LIQVQCPKCGQSVELDDDFEEPQVHCNLCDADFPLRGSPVDRWGTDAGTPDQDWQWSSDAEPTGTEALPGGAAAPELSEPPLPVGPTAAPVVQPPALPPQPGTARPLVVGMTGASGAPYAIRLLQVLAAAGREVHLVISPAAAQVLRDEMDLAVNPDRFDTAKFLAAIVPQAALTPPGATAVPRFQVHHHMDWSAGIASGSFLTDGMVICPCSMSTLGAISAGLSTNVIQRAADVHLKERRKLILVPRETPLNLIQLENMATCVRAGAIIMPAMPGWYHRPRSLDDLINFVVARVCDQLGVAHTLIRPWGTNRAELA
jgi:4-hydroxy-3-polyprenylbenzoate decarboxylase